MLKYIFLLIGFIVIIKASDTLVDSASSIAIKCKVPKMLVALTIVSFGTCAPEIAISFTSVANKNGTIAFANVIGSCLYYLFRNHWQILYNRFPLPMLHTPIKVLLHTLYFCSRLL